MSKRSFVDYYQVLGVDASATPKEISAAYLSLARKHHPDSSQTENNSAAEFKAVAEAYQTLSDPNRRREYDRHLRQKTFPTRPPRRRGPFQPTQAVSGSATFAYGFTSTAEETAASGVGCHAEQAGVSDAVADLPISPEEAHLGARVAFTLTVLRRCDNCAAGGCSFCGGQGNVKQRRSFHLYVPPRVMDGTVLRLPGEKVLVRVRIRPYWRSIGETVSRSRGKIP